MPWRCSGGVAPLVAASQQDSLCTNLVIVRMCMCNLLGYLFIYWMTVAAIVGRNNGVLGLYWVFAKIGTARSERHLTARQIRAKELIMSARQL